MYIVVMLTESLKPNHRSPENTFSPHILPTNYLKFICSSSFYPVNHVWVRRKKLQDTLKSKKSQFEKTEQVSEPEWDMAGML